MIRIVMIEGCSGRGTLEDDYRSAMSVEAVETQSARKWDEAMGWREVAGAMTSRNICMSSARVTDSCAEIGVR
jgi:hypothetical protein